MFVRGVWPRPRQISTLRKGYELCPVQGKELSIDIGALPIASFEVWKLLWCCKSRPLQRAADIRSLQFLRRPSYRRIEGIYIRHDGQYPHRTAGEAKKESGFFCVSGAWAPSTLAAPPSRLPPRLRMKKGSQLTDCRCARNVPAARSRVRGARRGYVCKRGMGVASSPDPAADLLAPPQGEGDLEMNPPSDLPPCYTL